jgi:HEAT repeat protein
MKMRRALWIATGLALLAALALLIPKSPVYLPTFFGWNQNLYEGHPVSYWIKALDTPDDEARVHAIHGLGALGPEAGEAVPALAKIMLESSSRVERLEAALALSKMVPASRTAVPALAQALEDQEPWIRMNAARTLAQLGAESKPAIPALLKAFKDPSNQTDLKTFLITIQEQIALALGRATAGTAEAVPVLMEALEAARAEKTVKVEAAKVGPEASGKGAPRMQRMAESRAEAADKTVKPIDVVIRAKVFYARALGEVGPEARPAVPLLRAMLQEEQVSDIRVAVEEALQKIEGKPGNAR